MNKTTSNRIILIGLLSVVLTSLLSLTTAFAEDITSHAPSPPPTHKPAERKATRRLPEFIKPILYDISLSPDIAKDRFAGQETITIKVDAPASEIWLHALDLKILSADLSDAAGKTRKLAIKLDPMEEMVSLRSATSIAPGQYKLRTTFSGVITDKLHGLYKGNYKDKQGKAQKVLVTQFEAADARRMLPCFDEPAMKARFKLRVRTLAQHTAISNAPILKATIAGGSKLTEFATTEPMSSYLLALVIGDFKSTVATMVEGVPIRAWAVSGMENLAIYSRDSAAKMLPAFNKYFRIPYPWKKLDLIAVPEFAAGAMENPGAITFRDNLLLIDPKTNSTSSMQHATSVIAHEMAHMWFGDLVTMQWWDDLWLNEAFATWMSAKAVDAVYPEWEFWKGYARAREKALDTDALRSTRPIFYQVKNPEQVREMFDVITYDKGCAVLRMLELHVGEPVFQKGVHLYLKAHSWGNATTEDLWNSIGGVSGQPIAEIMQGWVNQPGAPMLTVSASPRDGSLSIEQKRFILQPGDNAEATGKWMVPVGLRCISAPTSQKRQSFADRKYLLCDVTGEVPAQMPLIANAGGAGYYRTRYADKLFEQILQQPLLNFDPSERLALIDDSSALVRANAIPIGKHLDLMQRFKNETDDSVWDVIVGDLYSLDKFVDESERPAYQRFIRSELHPIFERLGWEAKASDSSQTRMLRGEIITALGTIGADPAVIDEARKRFDLYLKNSPALDRDLLRTVATVVAYNGTLAEYDQFQKLYRSARTPEDRLRNLFVLVDFADRNLAERTLQMALTTDVRLQDAPHVLGAMLHGRRTQDLSWEFIKNNWAKIETLFPEQMVPGVVSSARTFTSEPKLADLKAFVAAHPMPAGKIAIARTIERVSVNVDFKAKQAAGLREWLQTNYGG